MNTKELGDLGERIACEYLVKKGYKILVKNYRISFGEIDIIAKKKWRLLDLLKKNPSAGSGRAIHFVEVKTIIGNPSTNSGQAGSFHPEPAEGFFPEDKVDDRKQRKLKQMSQIWLEKNKFSQNYPYQIDVIGILIDQKSRKAKLHYFPNVIEDF